MRTGLSLSALEAKLRCVSVCASGASARVRVCVCVCACARTGGSSPRGADAAAPA